VIVDGGVARVVTGGDGGAAFCKLGCWSDRVGVPDLSVSGDNFDLVEGDPHDPTTTSEPEAPMQSMNQLPMVTDLVDARSA
jgi:hypothetical protein